MLPEPCIFGVLELTPQREQAVMTRIEMNDLDDAPRPPAAEDTVRKEVLLREDQLIDLGRLRRAVAAERTAKPERITDNALMRIAVDLLLTHAHKLRGNTEQELWESVTKTGRKAVTRKNS